jgi:hypothetical protein
MVFEKRGQWCWRDEEGRLHKFATEKEAVDASGWVVALDEIFHGGEKEEEKDSKEETSADEQAPVRSSKSSSKKKV